MKALTMRLRNIVSRLGLAGLLVGLSARAFAQLDACPATIQDVDKLLAGRTVIETFPKTTVYEGHGTQLFGVDVVRLLDDRTSGMRSLEFRMPVSEAVMFGYRQRYGQGKVKILDFKKPGDLGSAQFLESKAYKQFFVTCTYI